jgi:hypothetical protein
MNGKKELDKELWPLIEAFHAEHGKYPTTITVSEAKCVELQSSIPAESSHYKLLFRVSNHLDDITILSDPNQMDDYKLT